LFVSQWVASEPIQPVRARGHLLRILGVGFGIAVVIGGTIGSGILRTPGEIAAHLHRPGLIVAVWLVGGIYAFFGTLSVVELGTTYPFAGGWYVYARRAFGPYAGFVVGCSDWMVQTVSVAYLAVAFSEFSGELLPQFAQHQKAVGIGLLLALMLLNWIGLRSGSRTQEITSFIKALALVVFVVGCFALAPPANTASPLLAPPTPSGGLLVALVLSLQAIIVTYDGWYLAIYFTEEDKQPATNLPKSSLSAILACIAIYVLVNLALMHILRLEKFAGSQMPVADAAMALFGARGRQLILLVSLVAAISTINATVLASPRILFAIARDGLMPGWITSVNRGGTPVAALLVGTIVASALVLSGSFDTLIDVAAILFVVVYLSGFVSLFVLRAREPGRPRPFKAWLYPWGNGLVLLASAAFLAGAVIADLKHALFTVIFIVLTIPLYFVLRRRNRNAVSQLAREGN
jgi:basic amino acid/polyamine antiporter, APA family